MAGSGPRPSSRRNQSPGMLWAADAVLAVALFLLVYPADARNTNAVPRVPGRGPKQEREPRKERRATDRSKAFGLGEGGAEPVEGHRNAIDLTTEPFLEFRLGHFVKGSTPRPVLECVGAHCDEARKELPYTMLCVNRALSSSMLQQWLERQPYRAGYKNHQRPAMIEGCKHDCPTWVCNAQMSPRWTLASPRLVCDPSSGTQGVSKVRDTCTLKFAVDPTLSGPDLPVRPHAQAAAGMPESAGAAARRDAGRVGGEAPGKQFESSKSDSGAGWDGRGRRADWVTKAEKKFEPAGPTAQHGGDAPQSTSPVEAATEQRTAKESVRGDATQGENRKAAQQAPEGGEAMGGSGRMKNWHAPAGEKAEVGAREEAAGGQDRELGIDEAATRADRGEIQFDAPVGKEQASTPQQQRQGSRARGSVEGREGKAGRGQGASERAREQGSVGREEARETGARRVEGGREGESIASIFGRKKRGEREAAEEEEAAPGAGSRPASPQPQTAAAQPASTVAAQGGGGAGEGGGSLPASEQRRAAAGQPSGGLSEGGDSLWYAGIATASIVVATSAWGFVQLRGGSLGAKEAEAGGAKRGEKKRRVRKKGSGKGGKGAGAVPASSDEEQEPRRSTESKESVQSSKESESKEAVSSEEEERARPEGAKGQTRGGQGQGRGAENDLAGGEEAKGVPLGGLGGLSASSEEEGGEGGERVGKGKKKKKAARALAQAQAGRGEGGGYAAAKAEWSEEGWTSARGGKSKRRTLEAAPDVTDDAGRTENRSEGETAQENNAEATTRRKDGAGQEGGQERVALRAQPQRVEAQEKQARREKEEPAKETDEERELAEQAKETEKEKEKKGLVVTLPKGSPAVLGANAAAVEVVHGARPAAGAADTVGGGREGGEPGNRKASQELMSLLGIAGAAASREGSAEQPADPSPPSPGATVMAPPSPGATIMALLGAARDRPRGNGDGGAGGVVGSPAPSAGLSRPASYAGGMASPEPSAGLPRPASYASTAANGADPSSTPKLRKRKPRRDLDFSQCHPCGLYNGSGSALENLCFFNAAIQLLFHAIKDLAADLNRCTGAVAVAVRGLGEEVMRLQPAEGAGGRAGEVSQTTSERLRSTLSEHFSYLESPPARQSQCDAYEFLEGLLEVVREDVREKGGVVEEAEKKAMDKGLHERMAVVAQESRREPVDPAKLLESLHSMADWKWDMDMRGQAGAQAADESRPAAVTFAGQMITLTYDTAKRGLRRCEFEPFSVWAVPLQGESGGSPEDGVALEQLLVSYCRGAPPEGGAGLLRRTALWRLPDSLVICLRRFDNSCQKLGTAVRVPAVLDFARGGGEGAGGQGAAAQDKEWCVFGGGLGEGCSSVAQGCTYHVEAQGARGRSSPAADEGATYDLSGVCYHLGGTLDNGHYVAAVKGRGGTWWECNDSQCTEVELAQVLAGTVPSVAAYESFPAGSRAVYVMVYRKR